MARKTLGKMEFETLISDLREQNQTTSDYQEESTFLFTHIKNDLSIMNMSLSRQNTLLERYLSTNLEQHDLTAEKFEKPPSLDQIVSFNDRSQDQLDENKKSSKMDDMSIMDKAFSKQDTFHNLIEKYLTTNLKRQDLIAEKIEDTSSVVMQNYLEQMSLLNDKSQNQLDEDKKSSKLLGALLSLFVRKEKDEKRKAAEGLLEKVAKKDSKGSISFRPDKLLPKKGFLGDLSKGLSSFLSTALLGVAGKGFLSSVLRGVTLGSGFGMKFARLFGAALLLPNLWDSVKEGVKAYKDTGDISDAIAKSARDYFGKKSVLEAMGVGALTGFAILGPRGAIAGAILGGAVSALTKAFGEDKTEGLTSQILDFITSAPGALALTAAYAGSKLSKKQGKLGKIGKMGMRGGIAYMLIAPALDALSDGMKPKDGEQGLGASIKKFLFSDKANSQSLLEAVGQGALLGFTTFGLQGAIIGGILGGSYDILDDVIRSERAKRGKEGGLFTEISEVFSKFTKRVTDFFTLVFGTDEEQKKFFDEQNTLEKKQARIFEHKKKVLFELTKELPGYEKMYKDQLKREVGKDLSPEQKVTNRMHTKMDFVAQKTKGTEFDDLIVFDAVKGEYSFNPEALRKIDKATMTKLFDTVRGKASSTSTQTRRVGTESTSLFALEQMAKELGQIKTGEYTKPELKVKKNARGSQVYTKPTLALVAEKPGTAEYIMSDRNLARLAETIATQRENQTLSTIAPMFKASAPVSVQDNSIMNYSTTNSLTEIAPMFSGMQYQTALG